MIERPRRNRVTPFGVLEASAAKGLFLGNRGDLHAPDGALGSRRWASRAWICCTLSPKNGNRIEFDRKGTYYPLFFADEATAFAAGHRPCGQCRHQDYAIFKRFWQMSRGANPDSFVAVADIDRALHAGRVDAGREKITFAASMGSLPDGTMVTFPDAPTVARLVWAGHTHLWSETGYSDARPVVADLKVAVLTPEPLVGVLRAGYRPVVHPSVLRP